MKKIYLILSILALVTAAGQAQALDVQTINQPQQQNSFVLQNVPLVYQLAGGSKDLRLAQGCEESSIIMAVEWAQNKGYSTAQTINLIKQMSDYEKGRFGTFIDTSADDTAALMKEFFGQDSIVRHDITVEDLKQSIENGNIDIVHINARLINNPHYRKPAADHHTLVVKGFDPATDQFIVNDPGTRFGNSWRINANTLENALQDYPTGNDIKVQVIRTSMIEIAPQ